MPSSKQLDLIMGPSARRVFTVGEITLKVKSLLESSFSRVWVAGEISNCRRQASGHIYLNLKDEDASLNAVLFRGKARYLRFEPKDGLEVQVAGRLSVFAPRGQYQLIVDHMEPKGLGALQAAFDALKERLAREGLFDADAKKPVPRLPRRIGVVTSRSGAAVHDFLRVIGRRNPRVSIIVAPAKVQGDGAAEDVARQLRRLERRGDCDVLLLTRGGGSIEDLWAFNEELLARAIAACRVPVVSAVGHEVDFTIADLVADLRAPTPSAAAEMLTPEHRIMVRELSGWRERLHRAMDRLLERERGSMSRLWGRVADPRRLLTDRRLALEALREALEGAASAGLRSRRRGITDIKERLDRQHPRARLARLRASLNDSDSRIQRSMSGTLRGQEAFLGRLRITLQRHHPLPLIEAERRRLGRVSMKLSAAAAGDIGEARRLHAGLAGKLDALSPLGVLARGYALVLDEKGRVVRSAEEVGVDDHVGIRLAKGRVRARVTGTDLETKPHKA